MLIWFRIVFFMWFLMLVSIWFVHTVSISFLISVSMWFWICVLILFLLWLLILFWIWFSMWIFNSVCPRVHEKMILNFTRNARITESENSLGQDVTKCGTWLGIEAIKIQVPDLDNIPAATRLIGSSIYNFIRLSYDFIRLLMYLLTYMYISTKYKNHLKM